VTRLAGTLLLFTAVAAGCYGPSPRQLDRAADAARVERIERLGQALLADKHLAWGVSPREGLGAWAWPDGRVQVSRVLVDRLDDDELAAALAHELGHLLDGGNLSSAPLALSGSPRVGDLEDRADRIGCCLLERRGVPCEAMARMLTAVATGLGGDAELARRAAAIGSACCGGATTR
jgi:hypothetical protein